MSKVNFNFRYVAIGVLLCTLLGNVFPLLAQQGNGKTISGKVIDEANEALIGVSILVKGTSVGTVTDFDGNYTLSVPTGATHLVFSYIGYQAQTLPVPSSNILNVKLKSDTQVLNDVVVIGYGTQKKNDLTGTVTNVSSKDFNTGLINSAEELINGKVAGLQIVSNSGSPTSGSTIRIRGGASLNASNDPLIVLDGVPLESGGISGNSGNFLSLINPSDIESMTILKDASSTAIYGSRASNGVIIITTKKGGKDLKVDVTSTHSVQSRVVSDLMMNSEEYRNVINRDGSDSQKALLGNTSTDWNDEIFQLAYGTDNNVSVSTSVIRNVPLRISLGYHNQNGILLTDKAERFSGSLVLSPNLLNDHLKMNLSVKATLNKNRFAETGAIYSASAYNPTIGVYSGNDQFGGYNEPLDPSNGTPTIAGQVINPVGQLKQYKSTSDVKRIVGNFDIDYKFHFLPELRAHLILGLDHAQGEGSIYVPREAAKYYSTRGRDYSYGPEKKDNQLLTFYLNYAKEFEVIKSNLDFTAGYDYQKWKTQTDFYEEYNAEGEVQSATAAVDRRHVLVSFYGRLNYAFHSKYLLTATLRYDGSSRFSKDNRWSTFPSLALAWRVKEESFLKNVDFLSNLKLRFSYGVTGQQDGIGDYGYIPLYTISQMGAEYLFGNKYYYTYRPEAYVSNLKWESTRSFNIGMDFGFFNNRLTGEIDYYTRKTKDLLATVPSPAGANFDKNITTNVGNMTSQGLELSLSSVLIDNKDWSWNLTYNMTWQKMKITNLALAKGGESPVTYVGATSGGNYLQVLKEGLSPYSFYLYKQVYDDKGKPVEGKYESDERYNAGSPFPDFIFGLNSQLRYKKWSLGFSLRANAGAKVFNDNAMKLGAFDVVSWNTAQINNLAKSYLDTGFQKLQYLSDYYLEDASFLKMDNISLGYNFGKIAPWCSLNVSGMVQNVFTITGYSGADPEIYRGIDSSFYPRARVYSISVGLQF